MTTSSRLIADIGGTNARFARVDPDGQIEDAWVQRVAAFPSFAAALNGYLESLNAEATFSSAVVAGAGPVSGDQIELTNSSWRISRAELADRLGGRLKVHIINDLEAVAHAVPFLADQQIEFIDHKPKPIEQRNRMLVVNIGTGFGSCTMLRANGSWLSCPSEAGHMRLGACDQHEVEIFARLGGLNLTTEDILSGSGVRCLATVLQSMQLGTQTAEPLDEFDFEHDSLLTQEVAATITQVLARACSNLTLASAAWDGVYFCGSVATAWWRQADLSTFRSLYVDRSKLSQELERTPIGLIKAEHPAFIGLAKLNF